MGSTKKVGIILLLLLMAVNVEAFNKDYPLLKFEKGRDMQSDKQWVYSIPQDYYKYVDVIYFVNKPIKRNGELFDGYYKIRWSGNHKCYGGIIWLYNEASLQHELGHIYQICVDKKDVSTEQYANNFIAR